MHLCMNKDGNIHKLKYKSKNVHLFVKYTKKSMWNKISFKRHNLYGFLLSEFIKIKTNNSHKARAAKLYGTFPTC